VGVVNGIWQSQYGMLAVVSVAIFLALWSAGFFGRLLRILEEMAFSNWQLALLGATAVALSLASGYTTFDGLRNFTSASLLSVLISFGIQGVMLIVAWLIGESFATGMNQQVPGRRGRSAREAVIGMGLGVALIGLAFYWVLTQYSAVSFTRASSLFGGFHADWVRFADVALYFSIALVLVGLFAFNFRRGGDISLPYVQSVRLIAKNAVLWVMFLASMAASVFFSFDSHFNAIFPADQRVRAAELRTLNQVGGVVADIGERAQRVQLAEAEKLFDTDGWKAYDAQLGTLAHEAQAAQGEIEKFLVRKMEDRRRGIVEQQERIAGAERGQTALLRKRDELEAELQRIEPTIGNLEAELAKAQATYDETRQAIAAKRIDASAEDGGVEGTRKRGKGPMYRQRMEELEELRRKLNITDEPRLAEAQRLRDRASSRIVSLKREIATINGEVAKYKGESQTAALRIKAAEGSQLEAEAARIDPSGMLPAFERARTAFRQQPDAEKLAALQAQCSALLNAVNGSAARDRVRGVDCDPKQAAEAAARVFALNAGLLTFQASCAGGSKLPQGATTDQLLGFGRKCLQDSSLASRESQDLGARLQAIDMNRDDKAHRFVVTWNAFLDGNRLAYLALMLAIGVDALVFMAGLFGAAAVKSPLSDVPSPKARSAEQLEAVIDTALLPHTYENARLVLNAMRPMAASGGFTQRVTVDELSPHAPDLHRVLNAGATIGAVRHAGGNTYELRAELFEHLSLVAKRAFKADKTHVALADLERIVAVALLPDVQKNVDTVLSYVHPIQDRPTLLEKFGLKERQHDFTAEIKLDEVSNSDEKKIVRSALNAGATHEAVQRASNSHYFLSRDFYKTLTRIRARFLDGASVPALQAPQAAREGGQLREHRPAIAGGNGAHPRRIAHQPQRHQPSETAASSMDELKVELWDDLLGTIGLNLQAASRVKEPIVRVQAGAAWQAIQQLSQGNERLRAYLDEIVEARTDAVEQRYGELRSRLEVDSERVAVLDEIVEDLNRLLRSLLLLPEVGVLRDMVERLEGAIEQDSGATPGEEKLLEQLRNLEIAVRQIDRGSADGWMRIAQMISGQGHEDPPTIREMNPVNKRMI
jgi:hypothetical protein